MEDVALIAAIRAYPDDPTRRLVFADWLDEKGQGERAEWIRLSCALAQVSYQDPSWEPLVRRIYATFERCRPAYWQHIPNVQQENDRGMYRFGIGAARSTRSATTYKRLGNVKWLGEAFAQGWIERIDVL